MGHVPLAHVPLIDIDMGIGRKWCYDDRVRIHRESQRVRDSEPARNPAKCHPDREHVARGMCKACYARWWKLIQAAERAIERRSREHRLIGSDL